MEDITLLRSVTDIKSNSFYGCQNLSSINVDSANTCYFNADGVYDKDKIVLICCPGGKTGEFRISDGLTSIGDEAFRCCLKIESVAIPESVNRRRCI